MGKHSKRKVGKKKGSRRKVQRGGVINPALVTALSGKLQQAWDRHYSSISATARATLGAVTTAMILQYFMELGGLDSILSFGGNVMSAAGGAGGAALDVGIMGVQVGQAVAGAAATLVQTSGFGILWCFTKLQNMLPNVNIATLLGIGGAGGALYQLCRAGVNNGLLPELPALPSLTMDTVFESLANAVLAFRPDVVHQLELEAGAEARSAEEWVEIEREAERRRQTDEAMLLSSSHFLAIASAIMANGASGGIDIDGINALLRCSPVAPSDAVIQALSGNQLRGMAAQGFGRAATMPIMGESPAVDVPYFSSVAGRSASLPAPGCIPIVDYGDLGIAFGPPVDADAIEVRVREELDEEEELEELDEEEERARGIRGANLASMGIMGANPASMGPRVPGSIKTPRDREEEEEEEGPVLKASNQGPTPPGSQDTASTVLDTPRNSLDGSLYGDMEVNEDAFDEEETKEEGPLQEEKEGMGGGRRRSKKRRVNKKRRSTKKRRRQNKRRR